ncbi:hypothetical protein D3C85_1598240 [compost metagenome]
MDRWVNTISKHGVTPVATMNCWPRRKKRTGDSFILRGVVDASTGPRSGIEVRAILPSPTCECRSNLITSRTLKVNKESTDGTYSEQKPIHLAGKNGWRWTDQYQPRPRLGSGEIRLPWQADGQRRRDRS